MWLHRLRDLQAYAHVLARLDRLENGNFGQCRALQSGVWELKINHGPGYRVYFGKDGPTYVILLGGGTKKRQSGDISAAADAWTDYKRRKPAR